MPYRTPGKVQEMDKVIEVRLTPDEIVALLQKAYPDMFGGYYSDDLSKVSLLHRESNGKENTHSIEDTLISFRFKKEQISIENYLKGLLFKSSGKSC